MFRRVAEPCRMRRGRETGARPHRDSGGRQVSGPGPCRAGGINEKAVDRACSASSGGGVGNGRRRRGLGRGGRACCRGRAAVVAAVVAMVAVEAGSTLAAVAPLDAPAAMQPLRIAAAAKPAAPVTRRARRAGWGRRRRPGRGRALILVSISVFMGSSSATNLGGSSEHAPLSRRLCRSSDARRRTTTVGCS